MPRRFLVTGCGRSGTGYTAALLRALGVPCGHEAVFRPDLLAAGTVDWPASRPGEASWLGAPHLLALPEGTVVLHQVREPVAVVRSHLRLGFFSHRTPFLDFAEEHYPELRGGAEVERCLRYWLGWNRLVELAAGIDALEYYRYRLEDVGPELVGDLLEVLGAPRGRDEVARALAAVPRDTNTRGAERLARPTWFELPAGELRDAVAELAAAYGYAGVGPGGTLRVGPLPGVGAAR